MPISLLPCHASASKDALVMQAPEFSFEAIECDVARLPSIRCERVGCNPGLLPGGVNVARNFAGFHAESEFEMIRFLEFGCDPVAVVFEDLVEGFVMGDALEVKGDLHVRVHCWKFLRGGLSKCVVFQIVPRKYFLIIGKIRCQGFHSP